MPELPEVETIVRKLSVLVGKKLASLEVKNSKSVQGDPAVLYGQAIQAVERRAKIIDIVFANDWHLLIHLKMTGQLIYLDAEQRIGGGHPTADWVQALPSKHTRAVLNLDPTAELFFNDQRLFGWLKVVSTPEVTQTFAQLGPDVIDPVFTPEFFQTKIAHKRIAIKLALLDPAIVAGLGNIYVCDALNLAKINPFRPASSLTPVEVARVVAASKEVVEQGIALGGTTFDGMYVDTAGFAGQYQNVVRVYGRAGQPCQNCYGTIQKTTQGGRGTYFCPECQV